VPSRAEIDKVLAKWNQAWNHHDLKGVRFRVSAPPLAAEAASLIEKGTPACRISN
jgi:hypothetical protein